MDKKELKKIYDKEYKNKNKEKIDIQNKEYYIKIGKDRGKEKIKCPNCKTLTMRKNLTRHMRTKKCLDYIED